MTRRLAREEMSFLERAHAQRLGWGPFYVGGFILLMSVLLCRAPMWPWFICIAGPLTLAAVAWSLSRLDGWTHEIYSLACVGAGLFFVLYARALPMPVDPLSVPIALRAWGTWLVELLGATILLGIGWWSSKTKRTEVHLEDDLRGWQEIAQNFGLGMTSRKIMSKTADGNETGFFIWPRGTTTVRDVMNRREQLEGAMGMPEGTLRLMRHGRETNRVDYMSLKKNPLTESVKWPGPQQAPNGGDLSVDVPAAVGLNERGEVHYVPYIDRKTNFVANKLLGGTQGSGKSGGMALHLADLACRSDACQWGMDMKDGSEIWPWRDVLDNIATTIDEAQEMLYALDAIMDYRGQENTRQGRKSWPNTPEDPLLVVWTDELHRLLGARNNRDHKEFQRCIDIFTRFMTTGRALGMAENGATQNPTLEATHSSQIRDRFNQRICFRTEKEGQEQFILNSWFPRSDLLDSDAPGLCFIQDRDKKYDIPVRYYEVTDWMIEEVVRVRAPGLPLDTGSMEAAKRVSKRYTARLAERSSQTDAEDVTDTVTVISDPVPADAFEGPNVTLEAVYAAEQDRVRRLAEMTAADEKSASEVPSLVKLEGPNVTLNGIYEAAGSRPDPSKLRPPAPGEESVLALLHFRKEKGAVARELYDAAERSSQWFHQNWKKPMMDAGKLVQPAGSMGPYVLAEYVKEKVSTASGE